MSPQALGIARELGRAVLVGLLGGAALVGVLVAGDVVQGDDEGCASDAECWVAAGEIDPPPMVWALEAAK